MRGAGFFVLGGALGEFLFEIGDEAVLNLTGTTEVAPALSLFLLGPEAFEVFLHLATDLHGFFFLHPLRLEC